MLGCLDEDSALALVQGRLPDDTAASARAHSQDCSACRRLLATVAQVVVAGNCDEAGGWGPASDRIPRGTKLSSYTVLHAIGRGGMGVVYRAVDERLGRTVALKVISSASRTTGAVRRLRREAKMMAALNHPNIVAVHDVGLSDHGPFLVMELVDGVDLKTWLGLRPRDANTIVDVFLAAGTGLRAAHEAGIVHRDFKPHNVLIGNDGRVRVADFGLARTGLLAPSTTAATGPAATVQTAAVVGTPAYAAPEQLEGKPVDARADQFSFCVALYEAVRGERPFPRHEAATVGAALDRGAVARPNGLDRRRFRALLRGLRPQPGDRFPSMGELLASLRSRRPTRWIAAGVAVASVSVAALALRDEAPRCVPTPVTWAQPVGLPPAARVRLDAFASRWEQMYLDICERSGPALDQGMACLRDYREEFESMVAATGARVSLPRLQDCAEAQPGSTRFAAEANDLRRELGALRPIAAGFRSATADQRRDVLAGLESLRRRAQSRSAAAIEAEATRTLAILAGQQGRDRESVSMLQEAYFVAELAGHKTLAFDIALDLVASLAAKQREADAGAQWLGRARTVLDRHRSDPQSSARLLVAQAQVQMSQALWEDALRSYNEALQTVPEDAAGYVRADMLCGRGEVHSRSGNFEMSCRDYEAALEIVVAHDGPTHPDVARPLNGLAVCNMQRGRVQEAAKHLERALEVHRKTGQQLHLGLLTGNLGNLFVELGEYDRAIAELEDARDILNRELGATDARAARSHLDLAWQYGNVGRWSDARRSAAAAARWSEDAQVQTQAKAWAAEAELQLGNAASALAAVDQILAGAGGDPTDIAAARGIRGRALQALGRDHAAVAALASVVADPRFTNSLDPIELAELLLSYARALVKTGQGAEGREHAAAAALICAGVPGRRSQRTRIEAERLLGGASTAAGPSTGAGVRSSGPPSPPSPRRRSGRG